MFMLKSACRKDFCQYYAFTRFLFCDLATCHYGKLTMEWYKENGFNIVPKNANSPNCPELRPIEKYWAIMKRKLLLTKESVKNEKDFQRKWI